jgi:PII-like signaling protein
MASRNIAPATKLPVVISLADEEENVGCLFSRSEEVVMQHE